MTQWRTETQRVELASAKEEGNTMSNLTVKPNLEVDLPADVCNRYGITPHTSLRIIETRTGILLIPLASEAMDPELAGELEQWQQLGARSLDDFPYEEQ